MGRQKMQNEQKKRSQEISTIARGGKWYYDDENITKFNKQLSALGLELRDIRGDGNCLFRSLADQLNGHSRNHLKYRHEVVQYMRKHKEDFEPFMEDGETYENYLKHLCQPGTYAGNDAIVAFARLYCLIVVIHQLDSPMWQIRGTDFCGADQVHISYHNGEHYSSVRKIGDNSKAPACLKLSLTVNQSNLGTNVLSENRDREKPITETPGCINCRYEQNRYMGIIKNNNISHALKNNEMNEKKGNKNPSLWEPNGTGCRIFGDCATPKILYKTTETKDVPLKTSFLNLEETGKLNGKQEEQSKYKDEMENSGSNSFKSQQGSEQSAILVKDLNCLNI